MSDYSITLKDESTNGEIFVSLRHTNDLIGFAISLELDGDVEIFLGLKEYKRLLNVMTEFTGSLNT